MGKQVTVLNEFNEDITNIVTVEFGQVYNEFGDNITSVVTVIVKEK